MNVGWFDPRPGANSLFPLLGLGVVLVVVAWAAAGWREELWRAGVAGRAIVGLLVVAPAVYLLSWVLEFAIFGTLTLGLGLVLLAILVWRRRLAGLVDRVLVSFAAVGSLTWNTETASAFLLVGVGVAFGWHGASLRGPGSSTCRSSASASATRIDPVLSASPIARARWNASRRQAGTPAVLPQLDVATTVQPGDAVARGAVGTGRRAHLVPDGRTSFGSHEELPESVASSAVLTLTDLPRIDLHRPRGGGPARFGRCGSPVWSAPISGPASELRAASGSTDTCGATSSW